MTLQGVPETRGSSAPKGGAREPLPPLRTASGVHERAWIRHALAMAVAAMGLIDLLSALFSRDPERTAAVRRLLPTDILAPGDIENTARTFTLLGGALLLGTAVGLWRGKRRAFVAALLLCAVSVPVNVLKAFDFEEATVSAALMFMLGISADSFRVKSGVMSFGQWWRRSLVIGMGLAIYSVGGCWLIEARYGFGVASWSRAVNEALFQLFGIGDPALHLAAARMHGVVRWFLSSIQLMSVTTLIGIVLAWFQPAAHRSRHQAEIERVRELLLRYGDSTVASFALADDVDYFFSPNGRAVIAYRFESDTLLVVGDPLGPPEEIPPLLQAFAAYCREHDWEFAFYQARPEHLAWYRRFGWRAVHIGEDPVLWTDRFTLEGAALGTVRRAVRKLERQGLEVRSWPPGERPFEPGAEPEVLEELRAISAEWVRGHPGGERGFCMGRFDPARLGEHWLVVAWNRELRRVEAFCTWLPIPARRGWAIDLMRRRHDAPTGTMEFLVVKSVEQARERGDAMLSLSLSALAKVDEREGETDVDGPPQEASQGVAVATAASLPPGAITDDRAREFLMERLARFYDFKGLFRWKKKFNPVFEDRFLVYPDPLSLPRIARALLRAQSPGGLLSYLRRAA
ncbi:MAG TPA: phosphatidylglycerol lysyltransferase domain-containing protein [Candidatus Eisenbacteria bacterium]|nr:phosphatidylglycerol lysyltransferase domain-containing protein [Candidatus Eisenbacteria bacterium]